MPVATSLPAKNVIIRFPPGREESDGAAHGVDETYQLLELPSEILKAVESSQKPLALTIKGKPSDDAVICTPDSTFLLRAVTISNSLLICRPPAASSSSSAAKPTLEIRDVAHEILECVPQAANLEPIRKILSDSAWEGIGAETTGSKRKRESDNENRQRQWTRAQLESVIQASDGELERGLRERNVIEVEGKMLLLPLKHLSPVLSIILTLLTIHADSVKSMTAPLVAIQRGLEAQDVPPTLVLPILQLFGNVEGESWTADIPHIVAEIGRALLENVKSQDKTAFMDQWREAVGETWAEVLNLKLLEGDYLLTQPATSSLTAAPIISYFPLHQLPLHPPTRFADLFLTRAKWRPDEMTPFLKGLYRDGDSKERDKLVAKFVRVVKEKEGVWWYPRRTA